MSEARRFLRYLLPGLAVLLECLLLGVVLNPPCIWSALCALGKTGVSAASLSVIGLGVVVGSGYLFSLLHHWTMWIAPIYPCDHRQFLQEAVDAQLVAFERRGEEPQDLGTVQVNRMCKQQAWRVLCALWYENLDRRRLKNVNERQGTLGDLAHGAGAITAGSAISGALILWAYCEKAFVAVSVFRGLACVALWVAFTVISYLNTRALIQHAFRLPEIVLWDELRHGNAEGATTHVTTLGLSPAEGVEQLERSPEETRPPSQ